MRTPEQGITNRTADDIGLTWGMGKRRGHTVKLSNFHTATFPVLEKITVTPNPPRRPAATLLRLDFTKSQTTTNSDMSPVIEIRIE
jgi:hypothetical protein